MHLVRGYGKAPISEEGRRAQRLTAAQLDAVHAVVAARLAYPIGLVDLAQAAGLSRRRVIHVHEGKRSKDRSVMLSERLLAALRAYVRAARPPGPYLFPGAITGRPLTTRAIHRVLPNIVIQCGFTKR